MYLPLDFKGLKLLNEDLWNLYLYTEKYAYHKTMLMLTHIAMCDFFQYTSKRTMLIKLYLHYCLFFIMFVNVVLQIQGYRKVKLILCSCLYVVYIIKPTTAIGML
jgi:hypothetical protein